MTAATLTRSIDPASTGAPISADNRMKVGRVIRAADERSGGNVFETLRARDLAVSLEALRRNEFYDRQMVRGGPKILAHRQDLAADLAEVIHRLEQFRFGFTEAEHHPALRHNFRRKLLRLAEDIEGCPIFCARTHQRSQAFDCLQVVIENVGRGIEHDLDAPG